MITSLLEKIPVIIALIILVYSCAIIYFRSKNVNRSELLKIFKTAGYLSVPIIVFALVFTCVFGVFNHINMKQSVHAVISLNYSEASQALNSNGTRYNMAEIVCDDVVEKAIKKGALENVTVKQLQQCLSVYPIVQGGVGDESEYHISTEFAVEYHASKHTAHLDAENVIQLITSAYKDYYIEKYTDNFNLDISGEKPDFENMEYMDIVAYFDKETSSVLNYLYGMAEKNPSFVTEQGSTFNAIAGRVYQFKETQVNQNLRSLILQNGIAKNSEDYIDRLSYQNKNTDIVRLKNLISYELCNEAIDMYAEEMTRIVLVPTWDQSGKYYMGRTKVGIDELSVQATEYSNNVASNEKEIMDNELVIEKMKNSSGDDSVFESTDKLIDSMYDDIVGYEKEAVNAGRQYYNHKMNQCVAVSIYGLSLMSEIKTLVVYAIFFYIAFLMLDLSKKFKKTAL